MPDYIRSIEVLEKYEEAKKLVELSEKFISILTDKTSNDYGGYLHCCNLIYAINNSLEIYAPRANNTNCSKSNMMIFEEIPKHKRSPESVTSMRIRERKILVSQ